MRKALFVQHTNPAGYPPIQHAIAILLRAGWEVQSVGVGIAVTASLRMPTHPRFTARMMRVAPTNGMLQRMHFLLFCIWANLVAIRWRPDVVYASNATALPAALLSRFFRGTQLVYHEHDSPGEPRTLSQKAIEWCRKALCKKALLVAVPNATRAGRIVDATGVPVDRVFTVFNCPLRGEALTELPDPQSAEGNTPFWIYYHGSIVPDRLPLSVIDALALTSTRVCLRVVGYETAGGAGHLSEMRERAILRGVSDRVEFVGPVSRAELHQFARSSHVGLSLMPMRSEDVNMVYMVGASNKPFDYLASGCPLIVSDLPDWQLMFVDAGLASSCDPRSAASVAQAIDYWLTQPEIYRQAQAEGLRRIAGTWNYEVQFAPVMSALQCDGETAVASADMI